MHIRILNDLQAKIVCNKSLIYKFVIFMKTLDLNAYSVETMNEVEMENVDGGAWWYTLVGEFCISGTNFQVVVM